MTHGYSLNTSCVQRSVFKAGDKVTVESVMAPTFNGSLGIVIENSMGMVWVKFYEGHPDLLAELSCCFYPTSLRLIASCMWEHSYD